MMIELQRIDVTVEWNGLKVTVHSDTTHADKAALTNMFERAMAAVLMEVK